MSNIKEVEIEATVPFDWMEHLDKDDAAYLARIFMNPSIGIVADYTADGLKPNEHGGHTAMYRIYISGQEAINYAALDNILRIIALQANSITRARARDVENNTNWADLIT